LAPHHFAIENSYLDVPTIRRMMDQVHDPVLIVGGGQGLIVEALRKNGFQCDGIDFSGEMIRYARLRRGITLVRADATAMPLADRTYATVIYSTGVIDFTGDEERIKAMLAEGRRVLKDAGKIFVAFFRTSAAQERFLTRVGLVSNAVLAHRKALEVYLMNPAQTVAWVAKNAGLSHFRAATLLLRTWAGSTMQEKRLTFRMQRMFRKMDDAAALINAAPETQPYRNEAEIRKLFNRLEIPVTQIEAFASCYMVRVQ
jgi:ubiquinone/menaquinone biosynthesis C-methylase UbiE